MYAETRVRSMPAVVARRDCRPRRRRTAGPHVCALASSAPTLRLVVSGGHCRRRRGLGQPNGAGYHQHLCSPRRRCHRSHPSDPRGSLTTTAKHAHACPRAALYRTAPRRIPCTVLLHRHAPSRVVVHVIPCLVADTMPPPRRRATPSCRTIKARLISWNVAFAHHLSTCPCVCAPRAI